MTTELQARDEAGVLFFAAWPSDIPVIYDDVGGDPPIAPNDGSRPPAWARYQFRLFGGTQATLASDVGSRRFIRSGIITVQVFTPLGDGLTLGDSLARTARDAFEGEATTGLWFRDARIIDIGPSGAWYQQNILVDFEYDEVK